MLLDVVLALPNQLQIKTYTCFHFEKVEKRMRQLTSQIINDLLEKDLLENKYGTSY